MRAIRADEARQWLAKRGLDDGGSFDGFQLGPEARTASIPTPKDYQAIHELVAYLFAREESAFDGGMLWITDRVWTDELIATAIGRITASCGPKATGAYLFEPDELGLMKAMFALACLPNWDVYAVPAHGKYFFMGHHHEVIHLSALPDPAGQAWMASMDPWVKDGTG